MSSAAASAAAAPAAAAHPLPTFFLTHGGGPSYFMNVPMSHPFYPISAESENAQWLRDFRKTYKLDGANSPKAIVVVSAHWETSGQKIRVTSQAKHKKLNYDYGGFPKHTFELQFNPAGSPELAKRIVGLLQSAGVEAEEDKAWNFDHGVFVPLLMIFPAADIPVVEVSIDQSWDPAFHLNVGKALAGLKNEGVLVICSGSSTHNFNPDGRANKEFMSALTKIVESDELTPAQREQQGVIDWVKIPSARKAHPAEDHFVPFFVAVGAAGGVRGKKIGEVKPAGDWSMSSFIFE